MKRRTRNYAKRQLTWMRKLAGVDVIDVSGHGRRRCRRRIAARLLAASSARSGRCSPMQIREVAGARQRLPDRRARRAPLRAHARRACAGCARATSACSPTACCCSRPPQTRRTSRDLRIFNPDGSEAELSGNGAREAIMYLRRTGWTDADELRDPHRRRHRSARRSPGRTPARVDMGAARLQLDGLPRRRPATDAGSVAAGGRTWALPARLDRQPAVRDPRRRRADELERARPRRDRPADRRRRAVSRIARTCRGTRDCDSSRDAGRIRARIFERGVGETLSSGTGATRRGGRARPAIGAAATPRHA